MQKNILPYSPVLFVIVISTLLLLSLLPEMKWVDHTFRKINPLADVQSDPLRVTSKKNKLSKKKAVKKNNRKDTHCRPGLTCIEDFSKDKQALRYFFNALNQTRRKPVRVAFFGDSFIEGDILSASLRDTLQSIYGGRGVGYVPLSSEVAQFRTSIQHSFSNWETFSIVGKKNEWSPLCTPGYCFVPLQDNETEYRTARKNSIPFAKIRLFYTNPLTARLNYAVNDTIHRSLQLTSSRNLEESKLNDEKIQSIRLKFSNIDSLKVYGISFEENTGLYIDNLAMRGNSGMGLLQISAQMNTQFNFIQDYKLIILQYGLNVVTENDTLGYDWYIDKMVKVINRLKVDFPKSSILLVSVSDHSSNQNGKFKTIPYIPIMRDAQREIAQTCEIAFWDLFSAMGGENSMLGFVNAAPPLAAKDYTHLTFRGGKKIAKQMADAILFEREQYGKKKKTHP